MADLNALKGEVSAVVRALGRAVMAEVLTEINKDSERKLRAEGSLNTLVERLCVTAAHQILHMVQLTALRTQTPGHLEGPSGDLEGPSPSGDLEGPSGHLEGPPPSGHLEGPPPSGHLEGPPPSGHLEGPPPPGDLGGPSGHLEGPSGHLEGPSPPGDLEGPSGHLEGPSPPGDLEGPPPPGDLGGPSGHLEGPPPPGDLEEPSGDQKSPPEPEQSSRGLAAAGVPAVPHRVPGVSGVSGVSAVSGVSDRVPGVSAVPAVPGVSGVSGVPGVSAVPGVRPPPAQTFLLVYKSPSKFVLLPLQGHANANANGETQTCTSSPHLQPDVPDHEYARPVAPGDGTRRRCVKRKRERNNANTNAKGVSEPGGSCRCSQCGKLLPNSKLLSDHQRRFHPELHHHTSSSSSAQAAVPHTESTCPSAPAEGGASAEHTRKQDCCVSEKTDQQANANANAEGESEAVSEVKTTESPCRCSQCGKLYANAERLSDHKRKVHRVCSVCGAAVSAVDLRKHMMNEHGLLPYGCSFCPKRFNHPTHRNLHVKSVHTGEKNFHCDVCGKAYSSLSMVKTHRTTHFDKKFICDVCGRSFFHAAHLKRHKLMHQEVRPYQCSTCGKGFNQAPNLRRHQAHHTGDRPLCSICGRSYYNLKSHLISQHPYELPADDPLKARDSVITCEVCGRSFSTPSQFKIHQRSHTGEKPFSCDICGKSYRMNQQLREHRYSHTGEKPYRCPLCPKTFYLATSFMRHRSIHSGETPFSCLDCGKHFRLLTFLKAHQQTKAHLRKMQKKHGVGADLRGGEEEDVDGRRRGRR